MPDRIRGDNFIFDTLLELSSSCLLIAETMESSLRFTPHYTEMLQNLPRYVRIQLLSRVVWGSRHLGAVFLVSLMNIQTLDDFPDRRTRNMCTGGHSISLNYDFLFSVKSFW